MYRKRTIKTRLCSLGAIIMLLAATTLSGCGSKDDQAASSVSGTQITEAEGSDSSAPAEPKSIADAVNVHTYVFEPGLSREYKILYISDLHIIAGEDLDVDRDKQNEVMQRRESFMPSTPVYESAIAFWDDLSPVLDSYEADLILFGGDMIDYCSKLNLKLLENGLNRLTTPWLYVRADHDTATWYTTAALTDDEARNLHESVGLNYDILPIDMDEDFTIVGINNSTSQMTASQADELIAELDTVKPVLIFTHVPLEPVDDSALIDASKAAWDKRSLMWGADSYYVPDENTSRALERIYAADTPVFGVLAGHLHFEHDGMLTDRVRQIVAPPAYEYNICEIIVR